MLCVLPLAWMLFHVSASCTLQYSSAELCPKLPPLLAKCHVKRFSVRLSTLVPLGKLSGVIVVLSVVKL